MRMLYVWPLIPTLPMSLQSKSKSSNSQTYFNPILSSLVVLIHLFRASGDNASSNEIVCSTIDERRTPIMILWSIDEWFPLYIETRMGNLPILYTIKVWILFVMVFNTSTSFTKHWICMWYIITGSVQIFSFSNSAVTFFRPFHYSLLHIIVISTLSFAT